MAKCVECNDNLGILKGYRHPTLGKSSLVCGHCFDVEQAKVAQVRAEVLAEKNMIKDTQPDYFPVMGKVVATSIGLTKWLR